MPNAVSHSSYGVSYMHVNSYGTPGVDLGGGGGGGLLYLTNKIHLL